MRQIMTGYLELEFFLPYIVSSLVHQHKSHHSAMSCILLCLTKELVLLLLICH